MNYRARRYLDLLARGACALAVLIAIVPLGLVLAYLIKKGLPGLNWDFFTQLPKPVGEAGGGMANAILGSVEMVALAAAIGVPSGVAAAIFLAEFGNNRIGRSVRFAADVMSGVPSITVGLFVYAVVVIKTRQFSAWAGAIALAILMLPIVTRTSEELLRLVPHAIREAAMGLGVPQWRATLSVVLRTALPGIATGVMLSIARVAGETAPLLFTAFGNRFWASGLTQPTASLPVQIYTYAVSPYDEWHQQAWTAALVLVLLILFLNASARWLLARRAHGRRA
jgi:phosphate transport system permease protein